MTMAYLQSLCTEAENKCQKVPSPQPVPMNKPTIHLFSELTSSNGSVYEPMPLAATPKSARRIMNVT